MVYTFIRTAHRDPTAPRSIVLTSPATISDTDAAPANLEASRADGGASSPTASASPDSSAAPDSNAPSESPGAHSHAAVERLGLTVRAYRFASVLILAMRIYMPYKAIQLWSRIAGERHK